MSRMFKIDGKTMRTWNPFTGCRFSCIYCWARRLASGRLKHLEKYRNGFEPTFHPDELKRTFRPGEFVFVCDMGDISFASPTEQRVIMDHINEFPDTRFLLQTKRPSALMPYWFYKRNAQVYYGTTIETNRKYPLTQAPSPFQRYEMMQALPSEHKFISIEPIMDFDLPVLLPWLEAIRPEVVQIGADNHRCPLPEPPWEKVEELIAVLEKFTRVEKKDGLKRLKGAKDAHRNR